MSPDKDSQAEQLVAVFQELVEAADPEKPPVPHMLAGQECTVQVFDSASNVLRTIKARFPGDLVTGTEITFNVSFRV